MFTCFCSSCNAASFPILYVLVFFPLIWNLASSELWSLESNQGKGSGKGRNKGSIRVWETKLWIFGRAALSNFVLFASVFFLRKAKTNNKTRLSKVVRPSQQQKTVLSPGGLVLSLAVFLFVFSSICFAGYTHGRGASLLFLFSYKERNLDWLLQGITRRW